jgi:hypothetical protein
MAFRCLLTRPKNRRQEVATEVKGSAFAELRLSGRWALSILTDGWSEEEKAALLAGDNEAKEALIDTLSRRIIEQSGDFDCDEFQLRIETAEPANKQEEE